MSELKLGDKVRILRKNDKNVWVEKYKAIVVGLSFKKNSREISFVKGYVVDLPEPEPETWFEEFAVNAPLARVVLF